MKFIILYLIYAVFLGTMGYLVPRQEFFLMLMSYGICWAAFYFIVNRSYTLSSGLLLAAGLRMVLLFCLPWLSDDYYRFFFDGQLLAQGINPYENLPVDAVDLFDTLPSAIRDQLLDGMNSPLYYSVYTPLNQLFFWVSVVFTDRIFFNILTLRLIIVVFDLLSIYLLHRLTSVFGLPPRYAWLYAFNPLVIIELTGNLHFEGIVLFGLLLCLYGFTKGKDSWAALGWSFAVAIKLTPLLIGPMLLKAKHRQLKFWVVSATLIGICLSTLILPENKGFWSSLSLYQKNFEFNASVYYLLNLPISSIIGYNPIETLGPILSVITLILILIISYRHPVSDSHTLAQGIVILYLVYLLMQPVVHPWYLIPAFGISILTPYRTFLVWTALVFLSYGAYSSYPVQEKWYLLVLEYGVLSIAVFHDWRQYQKGIAPVHIS